MELKLPPLRTCIEFKWLNKALTKQKWNKMGRLFVIFAAENTVILGSSQQTSYLFCEGFSRYRKVVSSRLSWLVAHLRIFKPYMKGKFDAYVLWPLVKRVQSWIVDRSSDRDFMIGYRKDNHFWTQKVYEAQDAGFCTFLQIYFCITWLKNPQSVLPNFILYWGTHLI